MDRVPVFLARIDVVTLDVIPLWIGGIPLPGAVKIMHRSSLDGNSLAMSCLSGVRLHHIDAGGWGEGKKPGIQSRVYDHV